MIRAAFAATSRTRRLSYRSDSLKWIVWTQFATNGGFANDDDGSHLLMSNSRHNTRPLSSSSTFDDDSDEFKPTSENVGKFHRQLREAQKRQKKFKGRKTWEFRERFVDKIRLQCTGGRGGKGCLSHSSAAFQNKLTPDGGHGGAGGSVLLVAHSKVATLQMSRKHIAAKDGNHGLSHDQHGKSARNTLVRVPCGVVVKRVLHHGEEWDEENKRVIPAKNSDQDLKQQQHPQHDPVENDRLDLGYLKDVQQNELWEHDGRYYWKRGSRPHDDGKRDEENDDSDIEEDEDEDYIYNDDDEDYELDDDEDEDESDEDNDELSKMMREGQRTGGILLTGDQNFGGYDFEEDDFADMGDRPTVTLADLDEHGSYILVAKGGRGGIGTTSYAKTHRDLRPDQWTMAHNAAPELGEVVHLELELKLIADIGLVGFPNAGKSSLLRAMSRAAPKVAPYPFTTLHPLLGVIEYRDGLRIRAADIPGLIGGASEGKGMGHEFLRHIERTKALLYVVDAPGTDGRDPLEDLGILVNELGSYGDGDLLERRALVMANKTDLMNPDAVPDMLASLAELADELGLKRDHDVQGVSAGVTGEGLGSLSKALRDTVEKANKDSELALAAAMAEMQA